MSRLTVIKGNKGADPWGRLAVQAVTAAGTPTNQEHQEHKKD